MAGHYTSSPLEGLNKPPQAEIEKSRTENANQRAIHRFPQDIGPHAVIMAFREYQFATAPSAEDAKTFTSYSKLNDATDNPRGAIVLPLPTNLEDSYNVRISGPDLNVGGQLKAQGIAGGDSPTFNAAKAGEIATALRQNNGALYNFSSGAGTVAKAFIEEFAFTDIKELDNIALARIALRRSDKHVGIGEGFGSVVNPFVALSFQGVELKKHTFTWQLSPKSASESSALNHIIKLIKKNAAPEYATTNTATPDNIPGAADGTVGGAAKYTRDSLAFTSSRLLLKYPSMVDLWFTGIDPSYYYYFKRCMINDVTVNFNPTGLHTILKGGKPSFIQLSMTLIESQIHTRNDYNDINVGGASGDPDYMGSAE